MKARMTQPAPTKDLNAAITSAIEKMQKASGFPREKVIDLLYKHRDEVGAMLRKVADRTRQLDARLSEPGGFQQECDDIMTRLASVAAARGVTLPSAGPQLSQGEADAVADFQSTYGKTREQALALVQQYKARGMRFKARPRS